jgi:hypothetical protein
MPNLLIFSFPDAEYMRSTDQNIKYFVLADLENNFMACSCLNI